MAKVRAGLVNAQRDWYTPFAPELLSLEILLKDRMRMAAQTPMERFPDMGGNQNAAIG